MLFAKIVYIWKQNKTSSWRVSSQESRVKSQESRVKSNIFSGIKDTLISIIAGALILMFFAFYNTYPLVYSDTGTYIRSGFELYIPMDRPAFYGIFLRHSSLATSLWYVVFTQALILSSLIFILIKDSLKQHTIIYFIITIFILTFGTGISFNVSMLTADIFTAYLFLCMYLLLFAKNLNRFEFSFICFIFSLSMLTHISHILIVIITYLVLFIYFIIKKIRRLEFPLRLKRLTNVAVLIIVSIILLPSLNYIIGKKFIISEASHVFLMHKMHDNGLLVPYLNEFCEKKQYYICEYKEKLPWEIIWDPNSPITKDGDWSKYKTEDNQILLDLMSNYKYFKLFFFKCIHQTFKQFFNFNTGDLPLNSELINPPLGAKNIFFKDEIREFLSSRQFNNNKLNFDSINLIQIFVVYFSLIFLFIYLICSKNILEFDLKLSIIVLLVFQLSNAFVCSTFSNVLERYQSRVIWLIPLFALIIVFQYFNSYIPVLKNKFII